MSLRLVSALIFAALAVPAARAQGLAVVSVSPAPNAVAAPRTGAVTVAFDAALDPASVTAATVRVAGRWSGPVPGALTLSPDGRTVTFAPSRPFQAGEAVTVQLAAGLRTVGGAGLGSGRGFGFWAAAGRGTLDVREVGQVTVRRAGEGNIVTYGGIGVDLNGDRFNDFVVSNEATNDARVFLNDGAGRYGAFTVVPLPNGAVPSPLEGGDFNGDGRMDVAVANTGNNRVSVLLGDGAGGFPSRTSYTVGNTVRGIAALDLDGDGVDELVTANRTSRTVTVLKGRPDGTFAPAVSVGAQNVEPYSLAVADFDGDRRLDVAVANFGAQQVVVLRNDGAGGLVESGRIGFTGSPWMIAAGDVDNDGDADVAVASAFGNVVNVALGNGAGGFERVVTLPSGQLVIAIDLGDLDGDGDLDVVASSYSSGDFRVYENLGAATFGPGRRLAVEGAGSCTTLHDRDDDGDLDITGIDEETDRIYLYENAAPVADEPSPEASAPVLALAGPNPARDRVLFALNPQTTGSARLALYDALGREVAVAFDGPLAPGPRTVELDVSGLASGVYVARLEGAGPAEAVRIVKE